MKKATKNTAKIKLINYIGNAISLISSILTILSFYGYTNTHYISLIMLCAFGIILTIVLFLNKYRISKYLLVAILI